VVTSVIVSEGGGRWTEYAGGYSDMVAQRGYGLSGPAAAAAVAKKAAKREPERASAKRKLSFNDKRALETLPARMDALNRDLGALERKLADARLHDRDPQGFRRATESYAAKRVELERAESEWLRLEMLREEIEGAA
jgi:ATP-binding cassette subfamily F protein uup